MILHFRDFCPSITESDFVPPGPVAVLGPLGGVGIAPFVAR